MRDELKGGGSEMVLKRARDFAAKSVSKGGNKVKTNELLSTSSSNGCSLSIDYPNDGDILQGIHYAIRLGASNGTPQISFDGSDWKDCRNAGGYWWYDWQYFTPGSYKINARLLDTNGKVLKKASSKCRVK